MLPPVVVQSIKRQLRRQEGNLSLVFNALGDSGRFKIFQILMGYKDVCVSDIANILDITVSAASQQLRILELTGLVRRVRMKQMICYELKKENSKLIKIIKEISYG